MTNSVDAQKVDDCVNNCCYAYPSGSVAENRTRGFTLCPWFCAVPVVSSPCPWFLKTTDSTDAVLRNR
ncbi:hypothetical protein DTQ70_27575 [Runella sp. SP2]|nr:hypothetical protein DTQ70_27575 [Runella sp. SP2]